MRITDIVFDPVLPALWLAVIAGLYLLAAGYAAYRRLSGWFLRLIAFALLIGALSEPSLRQEEREPLPDVAFVLIDETGSQMLANRLENTADIHSAVADQLSRFGEELEIIDVVVPDQAKGTFLLSALTEAASSVPTDRIAGALLISDGVTEDQAALTEFPGPVHLLSSGDEREWDRRLVVEAAPAYAIVGEDAIFSIRIEDGGNAPVAEQITIEASLDGGEPQLFEFPVNETITLRLKIDHAGQNLVELSTPELPGELTGRNNREIVSINGIRDRLRVLLVSGEPYPGERTWRNLLKSDASVDLVHFTILRPPDKHDGVPYNELSLIAFPTRELFLERIEEFDLIIFDRYARRGILPDIYLQNVADYARRGGALLVASGQSLASVQSLSRSALRDILPGSPTGRVFKQGYQPIRTEAGERHPVTLSLDTPEEWGRWLQQVEIRTQQGATLLSGVAEAPLLQLARVGEGRVAMLASDQIWLWARGFEGGGPHRELLRRLIHWLMQEPDLEEEALSVGENGDTLSVALQTMQDQPAPLLAEAPDGTTESYDWIETGPGRWQSQLPIGAPGVWRLSTGELVRVIPVGGGRETEFENPLATGERLQSLAERTGGAIVTVSSEGMPDIRMVREDRPTAGRGWIGLTKREAYRLIDIRLTPLAPEWLWLSAIALLMLLAWRIEGR